MKYLASTDNPDYEEQGNQDRLERPEPRPARPLYRAHAPYQPHPRHVYPDIPTLTSCEYNGLFDVSCRQQDLVVPDPLNEQDTVTDLSAAGRI